ncbi:cryptococcal mannosyltransferase 1-domain-containing protein [Boeremia exigua]|uniref:cryptococcal mannosyltransferase 1-domain-containing protein n=1 Tax=Boeremia exigua TaxID=749465 RepID=UPI001E8E2D2C|nr:cryptococcal mannosyltransferase 1-domain-containing protein [Boeremia exigua]KAH6620051.1 cryptococcal mannosyltransferase 1-domain-containing protein [Boeremia exigua]
MKHNTAIVTRRRRSYSFRRLPRSSTLKLVLLLFFIWDSLHCISLHLRQTAALPTSPPPPNTKRIYIAAQHYNSARLLREHWNEALYTLVQELGVDNVFVSIYESGSFDETQQALRELDANLDVLKVKKEVVLSELTHKEEIQAQPADQGWIDTPAGVHALRRIPFLASIRNKVFQPLEALAAQGEHFDTILFLNDVAFNPTDVLRLLDTNEGDYAAACSLDFSKPPYFYDTFALRDTDGHEAIMQTWPYFRSYESRNAAERFLPVPVSSCWNGMVAMPAEPFLGEHALRFRGTNDSLAKHHLEGSECCLIHADNPLSATRGVFLNPAVQVGYNMTAYNAVRSSYAVMSPLQMYGRIWQSRVLRWTTTVWFKERVVHNRVMEWTKKSGRKEPGEFCLVNEMQVIFERGWKHV